MLQPPSDIEPHPDCEGCEGTGIYYTGVEAPGGMQESYPCECLWRYDRMFDLVPDEALKEIRERWRNGPSDEAFTEGDAAAYDAGKHRGSIGDFVEFKYQHAWKAHAVNFSAILDEIAFQRFNARAALRALLAGDKREAIRMLRGLVPEESKKH